jgi:outer membrane receptor protein involved in Fe transport
MKKNFLYNLKMAAFYSFMGFALQAVFISVLFAFTPSEAQNLHEVTLSINSGYITLEKTFQVIEAKTGFHFNFIRNELPLNEKIDLNIYNSSLYEVLFRIAKEFNLIFSTINNQIIVKKSDLPQNNSFIEEFGSIKGKVYDANTKEPLIGAYVIIKGTQHGASTDTHGSYMIVDINPGSCTLVAKSVGYISKEKTITVSDNKTLEINFWLEQSDINMNEVVVTTSTVIPTPVKMLPNTINIITNREIEKISPLNVAELVRLSVPGAIYTNEGIGTTYGAFSVRGVSSIQGAASTLKVYIDGVEITDPAFITFLDPSIIERVEVVPGPQASTIYGSRAISGVMQIFTKRSKGGTLRLSGKVGMETIDNRYVQNTTPLGQEYALNASGGYGSLNYNFGINGKNEPQWVDLFEEQALNLSGSTLFSIGNFTGGISLNYSKRENISGWNPISYKRSKDFGATLSAPDQEQKTSFQNYALNMSYKVNENWCHNLTVGYNGLNMFLYDRSPSLTTQLYSIDDANDYRWSVSYNTSYQLNLSNSLCTSITLGLDWDELSEPYYSDFVPDRTNYQFIDQNPGKYKNIGFFGQSQIAYNDFIFFTAGLRCDKKPEGAIEKYTWSPRLGLSVVDNLGEWMIKGRVAWGQAVVIPDAKNFLGEEGADYIVKPNLNLLSEVQRGYEIGFDLYHSNILSLGITYFYQTPLDLIEMVYLETDDLERTIYQYQNVDEIKNEGIEIKGIVSPFEWLTLNLNFGKTKSTILKTGSDYTGDNMVGDELTGQPKYTFSANIEITPFEGTSIVINAFQFGNWTAPDYTGFMYDVYYKRYDPSVKSFPKGYNITYPEYTKINLGITQKITNQFSGFLRINNLTNTDKFERVNTIITLPRSIFLGVQFSGLGLSDL